MQANFPEPVKEPILRHVSFSIVPRIDLLVDQVYTKFKDDYFPGDKVIVKYPNGYRAHGIIKEKVVFNSRIDSNGVLKSPFISYRVYLPDDGNEIDIEDASTIYRERNRFTKSYVKTFLKISLVRSNRLGAPWVIRDDIAQKYKISLEWPSHLKKFDYINSKNQKKRKVNILNDDDDEDENMDSLGNIDNDADNDDDDVSMDNNGIDENDTDTEIDNDLTVDVHNDDDNYNNNNSKDDESTSNGRKPRTEKGMKSTRGFSHTIFENLKETPPTQEDMNIKWCESWYKILKRTTAYFEDIVTEDKSRDKVIKLFKFCGITVTDTFDPNNTHFIITQRQFFSKNEYPDTDPFHYVHIKRIKVWHYEKCQRFFKSIKISNRKIYQLEKQQTIDETSAGNNENNGVKKGKSRGKGKSKVEEITENNSDVENHASADGFVNIAPAPEDNSKNSKAKPKTRGKGKKNLTDSSNDKSTDGKKSKKNKISDILNDDDNKDVDKTTETKDEEAEKKSHKIIILEDLLLPFKDDIERPKWKQLSGFEKLPLDIESNYKITLSNVLEVWMFINMFHEALVIDTFTFDDFLNAIQWKNSTEECPLLIEIFCSMLSCIMNEKGEMLVNLPLDIERDIKMKERAIKRKALLKEKEKKKQEEKQKKLLETKNSVEIKDEGEAEEEEEEEEDDDGEDGDDEDEGDDEDSDDDDEQEDINHNAYSILNYKKVPWRERLQKRDFKNGSWLIVLFGVFSTTEYIKEFKPDIVKVYELLAPLDDDTPTPEKLKINFYEKVSVDQRISILSILMNLLLNGNVIRQHIDHVVDKSASLRREKLEIQKEIKLKIESAHAANKEVLEFQRTIDIKDIKQRVEEMELSLLKTEEEKEKYYESKNKGGRPTQNFLPTEPSSLEKAIAASNPDFLKLLNTRSDRIKEVDNLKKQRIEIDKTLVELNTQRVRYLGRDRFWNRYWWFERNGLPNLGGNKGDEEDEEDGDDNSGLRGENGRENGQDEDYQEEEESDGEYDSETYLMGRIWVQGPSVLDQRHLLKNDEDGLKRKVAEEGEMVLKKENDWAYIDEVKDFEDLIVWLEDKGTRERALKKELKDCKNRIINSFKARLKFLAGDERKRSLIDYIKKLENKQFGEEVVSKDETKVKEEHKEEALDNEGDVKINEEAKDEAIEEADDEEETVRETRSNRRATRSLDSEDSYTRTRKRQRTNTYDSIEINPNDESLMDVDTEEIDRDGYIDYDKDEEEVIKMVRLRELPSPESPTELCAKLLDRARRVYNHLEQQDRIRNMQLWVNSSAIEKQGYTHYEGPKVVAVKTNKGRKTRSKTTTKGKGRGRR